MKKLIASFVAFALLLLPPAGFAATYYVSECAGLSGQHGSCAAGNDSSVTPTNPATPWRTFAQVRSQFNSLSPGDEILLAKGGTWTATDSPNLRNTNSTGGANTLAGGAIKIGAYNPSWGGSARPIIEISGTGNIFAFHINGAAPATVGGYILEGLELRGKGEQVTVASATTTVATVNETLVASRYVGCDVIMREGTGSDNHTRTISANTTNTITVSDWPNGTPDSTSELTIQCGLWGVQVARPVYGLTMRDMWIERFGIAVNCYDDKDYHSTRIDLLSNTFIRNTGQGVIGGCSGRIAYNDFQYNGQTNDRDHQLYLGGHWDGGSDAFTRSNIQVIGNSFTNNAGLYGSVCPAVIIVVHGRFKDLDIIGNRITLPSGGANSGCWGIGIDPAYGQDPPTLDERYEAVRVAFNTIVNVGGIGIGCASCVAPIIESNLIVKEDSGGLIAIQVPDRPLGTGDAATTSPIIRSNTCYYKAPTVGDQCIALRDANSGETISGSTAIVHGNVGYFGATAQTNHQMFDTTGLTLGSIFTNFSHNTMYDVSANGSWDARGTPIDSNRVTTDPGLTVPTSGNSWNASPTSGSSGVVGAASATYSSKNDAAGCKRPSPPARGYREYAPGCAVVPGTPTGR